MVGPQRRSGGNATPHRSATPRVANCRRTGWSGPARSKAPSSLTGPPPAAPPPPPLPPPCQIAGLLAGGNGRKKNVQQARAVEQRLRRPRRTRRTHPGPPETAAAARLCTAGTSSATDGEPTTLPQRRSLGPPSAQPPVTATAGTTTIKHSPRQRRRGGRRSGTTTTTTTAASPPAAKAPCRPGAPGGEHQRTAGQCSLGERPIGNRRLRRAWLNRVHRRGSGWSCWRHRGAGGDGACVAASLVVVDVGGRRLGCAACGWSVVQPAAQRAAGLAIYHVVSAGAAGGAVGWLPRGGGRVWGVDGCGCRRVLVTLRRMRCRG